MTQKVRQIAQKRIDKPTYYRVAQKCSKGGKILGPPSAHRPIAPQEEIVARKGLTTAYNGIFIKYLLCVCFDVSCPCNFWNGRSWFTAKEAKQFEMLLLIPAR